MIITEYCGLSTKYCIITRYCVLQYLNQKGVFYPINPENKSRNLYEKQ
jgi:hypothetical protein